MRLWTAGTDFCAVGLCVLCVCVQTGLLYALFGLSLLLFVVMVIARAKSGRDGSFNDARMNAYVLYVRNMFNGMQQKQHQVLCRCFVVVVVGSVSAWW
jgi:hypothetical protein